MAQPSNLAALLAPGAKARGLDLQALLAIASHEGAGGGIGDGGHAFGPFQLNDAGGVLTGKLAGLSPEQKNEWAWSPAGIKFAEDGIAKVASGQHGAQAIQSIASRFERPANVQAEISDALAHYGKSGASRLPMSVGAPVPSPGAPTGNSLSPLLGSLIASTNQSLGLGSSPNLAGLFAQSKVPVKAVAPPPLGKTGGLTGAQPTGFVPVDGVKVDSRVAPEVAKVVRQFGVTPTSGLRDAAHNRSVGGASNSDHLRGDAVDFAGPPAALSALYKWSQGRFPYVEPMSQSQNHVHVSFRR